MLQKLGPGYYDTQVKNKDNKLKSPFCSMEKRFRYKNTNVVPGPGRYENKQTVTNVYADQE